MDSAATPLDPREQHVRIPGPHPGLRLFLRHLPPAQPAPGGPKVVLYVHGATFPSALSIAHRFDGLAWRDVLCAAGFDVWGLDFYGFGLSDPPPALAGPADAAPPPGRTQDASRQLEAACRFVAARHGGARLALVAHSWGSMPAADLAGRCPDLVARLVLFAPIVWRPGGPAAPSLPAWRLISRADQWTRFVADTPPGAPPVLLERHFRDWGERWLDSDAASRTRTPPSVKVPLGPSQDIQAAWAGERLYDPALIRAPVSIIRGAWDSLCPDADAARLFDALTRAAALRDVKLGRGGHLLHLEEGRFALYRDTLAFLDGGTPCSP